MDFSLTPEQRLLQKTARRVAERYPDQAPDDYPYDFARVVADAGLAGIALDVDDGGQGATLLDAILVIEAMTVADPRSGDIIQATNFGAIRQIAALGDGATKARYLAPVLAGDAVASVAITEPGSGSAVSEMRTTATISGSSVRIDGSKIFNTHGPYANHYVVWARFAPGSDGIGAVVVPADTPGFSRGATEHYLSGEPHCALYFDGCEVPVENVLAERGGLRRLMPIFNIERLGNAARSLGCGERAFGAAVAHIQERRQFGRPLADNQGLRWAVARMRVQLDSARLLLYRAAAAPDGVPSPADSSIAKYACNVAGFETVNQAIQLFGAAGLSTQSDLPYLLGRTRGWMIAGGSLEMMQDAIARSVLGRIADPET